MYCAQGLPRLSSAWALSLQEYHNRSFSSRKLGATAVLSSRLLIPLLTMWAAAFGDVRANYAAIKVKLQIQCGGLTYDACHCNCCHCRHVCSLCGPRSAVGWRRRSTLPSPTPSLSRPLKSQMPTWSAIHSPSRPLKSQMPMRSAIRSLCPIRSARGSLPQRRTLNPSANPNSAAQEVIGR